MSYFGGAFDVDCEDSLTHYGVKGMKWGVRKDEAMLLRMAGAPGVRSVAPDPKVRKQENRQAKQDWKKYTKSTTRAERLADAHLARESKVQYLVDRSMRKPDNTVILLNSPGMQPTLVSGRQFIEHLQNGGAMAPAYTSLFGELEDD